MHSNSTFRTQVNWSLFRGIRCLRAWWLNATCDEKLLSKPTKSWTYEKLAYGNASCAHGASVGSPNECSFALRSLGLSGLEMWSGFQASIPAACSVHEFGSGNGANAKDGSKAYWNNAVRGWRLGTNLPNGVTSMLMAPLWHQGTIARRASQKSLFFC